MKNIYKIIGIFVFSLFLSNSCFAKDYLFSNNIYTDCDIISKKDVSYFQNLSFIEEKEILFWDRRAITSWVGIKVNLKLLFS